MLICGSLLIAKGCYLIVDTLMMGYREWVKARKKWKE